MRVLYTAEAVATGDGRGGHVRTSGGLRVCPYPNATRGNVDVTLVVAE